MSEVILYGEKHCLIQELLRYSKDWVTKPIRINDPKIITSYCLLQYQNIDAKMAVVQIMSRPVKVAKIHFKEN